MKTFVLLNWNGISDCRLPEGSVDAILSYCHNNLSDVTLRDMLPYLHRKGVAVISASFSSMGLLTQKVRFQCQFSELRTGDEVAEIVCILPGGRMLTDKRMTFFFFV